MSSRTPWKPTVGLVSNGELVNAEVVDRPLIDLERRTSSLKKDVEDLGQKSGRLVFSAAQLGTEVIAGDLVYFDAANEEFKPALADLYQDPIKGRLIAGPKSRVIGLVLNKTSPQEGDILISGRINLNTEGIDLDTLLDGAESDWFTSGALYLSTTIPGKATPNRVFPSIQLGFFSAGESVVLLNHKDLFESHEHYRFDLVAQPSASQNFLQTGWTSFEETGAGVAKRVDYYNEGASAVPPVILLCVRSIPTIAAADFDAPIRVEIYNDAGLQIELHTGSVGYLDPTGTADDVETLTLLDWPDYGEWVAVGDTNLEIAFIRADDTYDNTLEEDADTLLTATTQRFKVFLPEDLSGWTNANPFDLSHSEGALYRYIFQNDTPLNGIFPPLPTGSSLIELNGVTIKQGVDFDVTHLGIFWRTGTFDGSDVAPWPSDYSLDPGVEMVPDNGKNIVLSFIKSALGGLNSVVYSLKGIAPIKISRCPDSASAINGNLQIELDLALSTSSAEPATSETALSSVSGVTFVKSTMVSELIEGAGIRLENITPLARFADRKVGLVRISARGLKFEGEVSSIALRNAKEVLSVVGTHIDFIVPSAGASGITASFKLPNEDFNPLLTRLHVRGQFRGDLDVPGASSELFAMFKVACHVMRPGFVVSAMNDASAVAIQYWRIPFAAAYAATTILPLEYPYLDGEENHFEINADTLAANPLSLVALNDGFKTGDRVVLVIDRVTQDLDNNVANYTGRVGLSGLRWHLK